MLDDLIGIKHLETFKVEITHPATGQVIRDKDGKAAFIEVYSANSERAQEWLRAEFKRRERIKGYKSTPETDREMNDQFLTHLTAGWHLFNVKTGKPLPFSADEAFNLYSSPGDNFIRRQVNDAAQEASNFFPEG